MLSTSTWHTEFGVLTAFAKEAIICNLSSFHHLKCQWHHKLIWIAKKIMFPGKKFLVLTLAETDCSTCLFKQEVFSFWKKVQAIWENCLQTRSQAVRRKIKAKEDHTDRSQEKNCPADFCSLGVFLCFFHAIAAMLGHPTDVGYCGGFSSRLHV